jgi:hypothetical protein
MASSNIDKDFIFASSLIKVIAVVIALIVVVISRYAFIFFSAAMLPTIFAIFFDKNEHKCLSATICSFNLIGVLPYLIRIWDSSNIDYVSKHVLSSPDTWMVIYGAAFVGQLIYFSLPLLIAKFYTSRTKAQIGKYKKQHEELCNNWGIETKS